MGIGNDEGPEILVLNDTAHGMPAEDYVVELRERLPEHEVRLGRSRRHTLDLIENAPLVTGAFLDDELLAAADDLRLFAAWSAGVGHLPMDALAAHGVAVTTASGVHGPNVAEQVLGYTLVFTRRLDEGLRRNERSEWSHYRADELQGSTVTIVGLGAIGHSIAERFSGFHVETIGVRHSPEKGGPVDEVVGYDDVDAVLSRTDVLVLSCPLTDTTAGLIGDAALSALPPNAIVINVARGPVVDTDALVSALRTNGIRGAALDVTDPEPLPNDHPLWDLEKCLVTPHNAGHSPEYFARLADIVAENVQRIEETGEFSDLRNRV